MRQTKIQHRPNRKAAKYRVSFGSHIRTYALHPQSYVKDRRTGLTVPGAEKVLDGAIDPFINAYLKHAASH